MNEHQLETKISQDGDKEKKDLSTLLEESGIRYGKYEDTFSLAAGKAKEEINTWVGANISQLSEGFEKLAGDAREAVVNAAVAVKNDVGHGLSEYNAKAQEVADKVPGGFGKKTASYPWVAISFALVVGFLLGIIVKPAR